MEERQLLEIADQHVPLHLRGHGRVVAPVPRFQVATKAGPPVTVTDVADELAEELGVESPKQDPRDSADVEFYEQTPLGRRVTVVQIRKGQVQRILKQG